MTAKKKLTEYERRRLENIKRNDEVLASLKLHSRASELSAISKSKRVEKSKSYKTSPQKKKLKSETPVVVRRSLRTRGVPPDASTAVGIRDDVDENPRKKSPETPPKVSPRTPGPLSMVDVYNGEDSGQKLVETIKGFGKLDLVSQDIEGSSELKEEGDGDRRRMGKVWGKIDAEALKLKQENIARVVPGRIINVKFYPTRQRRMVVAGNKFGNVGFWNVDAEDHDGDGIYLYRPHSGPVSSMVINPFFMTKMFSSCYDGFIRLMDVEREVFDLVYSSDYPIFSMSQRPDELDSLYFGEGKGQMVVWDVRTGKCSSSLELHEDRINTIDFNSDNPNIMVTSSTDGTACVWDLRKNSSNKIECLKTINHTRAVHSAYFSPSGRYVATTSVDDKIGLLSGANYENVSMLNHYNQTGRWISSFRGIWGWDDSYIFIGNMRRGVDVISVGKNTLATLQSEHMTAIPCRFDAHPTNIGMLGAATSGGQVYIWTLS